MTELAPLAAFGGGKRLRVRKTHRTGSKEL
jgi:hypothetical protein